MTSTQAPILTPTDDTSTDDVALTRRRDRRRTRPGAGRVDSALRWIVATVIVAAVGAGVLWNEAYRSVEATIAAWVLRPFVDGQVGTWGTVFYVQDGDSVLGLRITAECTALVLIAPLLLLSAVLLVAARTRWARSGLGILVMIAVITVVNEIRLALIGFSTERWGVEQGYVISHTFVGSVIGIIGFVLGLSALILITVGRGRKHLR
jgi:exosortase/archaeosortase family protein